MIEFESVKRVDNDTWVLLDEAVKQITSLCAKLGINSGMLTEIEKQEAKHISQRKAGEEFYHVMLVKLADQDTFTVSFLQSGDEYLEGLGLRPKQG